MSKKRILIADDKGELRKLIRMTLEFGDYELHEAENGQRTLDLAKSLKPDIVILDVMMPVMDGVQATRVIRQLSDSSIASIPIVALSANAFEIFSLLELSILMPASSGESLPLLIVTTPLSPISNEPTLFWLPCSMIALRKA